jgi:DNA polymerase III alpha subunit
VEDAYFLGLWSLALTERDGVCAIVQAHLKAEALGVKLLAGAEMSLRGKTTLVLIARNRERYVNIRGTCAV